jgi:hypothetical protein
MPSLHTVLPIMKHDNEGPGNYGPAKSQSTFTPSSRINLLQRAISLRISG